MCFPSEQWFLFVLVRLTVNRQKKSYTTIEMRHDLHSLFFYVQRQSDLWHRYTHWERQRTPIFPPLRLRRVKLTSFHHQTMFYSSDKKFVEDRAIPEKRRATGNYTNEPLSCSLIRTNHVWSLEKVTGERKERARDKRLRYCPSLRSITIIKVEGEEVLTREVFDSYLFDKQAKSYHWTK